MDARNDGLCKVPQWTWRRRTIRRGALGLNTRRKLLGTNWVRLVVQFELQDISPTDVGGSGEPLKQFVRVISCAQLRAQVITYEKASGWIMWTWKTEQADEWSYQAGLRYGWIPGDPTSRRYPNICG